jgi:hypothetical protein
MQSNPSYWQHCVLNYIHFRVLRQRYPVHGNSTECIFLHFKWLLKLGWTNLWQLPLSRYLFKPYINKYIRNPGLILGQHRWAQWWGEKKSRTGRGFPLSIPLSVIILSMLQSYFTYLPLKLYYSSTWHHLSVRNLSLSPLLNKFVSGHITSFCNQKQKNTQIYWIFHLNVNITYNILHLIFKLYCKLMTFHWLKVFQKTGEQNIWR